MLMRLIKCLATACAMVSLSAILLAPSAQAAHIEQINWTHIKDEHFYGSTNARTEAKFLMTSDVKKLIGMTFHSPSRPSVSGHDGRIVYMRQFSFDLGAVKTSHGWKPTKRMKVVFEPTSHTVITAFPVEDF